MLTLSPPREPASSLPDDERGAHAARSVVGERAPEPEPAGQEARLELADAARAHRRDAVDPGAADPLQPQVVLVLAEVRELDDRAQGMRATLLVRKT